MTDAPPSSVLVLGANGFVGRHLVAALIGSGFSVTACVRDAHAYRLRFPGVAALRGDLARDTRPDDWLPRLAGVSAVVNCAGLLDGPDLEAVHVTGPAALYRACAAAGVGHVVLISAISADPAAGTVYASTKARGEALLAESGLGYTILRPSLVLAPDAYGGTALLRAIAASPLAMPLPGDGGGRFSPISAADVARAVVLALQDPRCNGLRADLAGTETVTVRELLVRLRAWLGFAPAPVLRIPTPLVRLAVTIGQRLGGGPFSRTALDQMAFGNAGTSDAFTRATGFAPMGLTAILAAHPSGVADRWHARLYPVRPLLRVVLALVWIVSGVVGFFADPALAMTAMAALGLPAAAGAPLALLFSLADIALGVALLLRLAPGATLAAQLGLTAAYTAALSIAMPELWADTFGPLLKNAAIAGAALALWAIDTDR